MCKFVISIVLSLAVFGGLIYYFATSKKANVGTVIVLNGPSGSGKSSVQTAFQYLMMPNLWIKLGIDTLFDKPMPDISAENLAFWQAPNLIRWVENGLDDQGKKTVTLLVGKDGEKVAYGMNSAIAAYAQNGCNVIVDYIAYKQEWFADLHDKLKPFKVYYVAIDIPLDILEQREAARGTSPVGHARSHYHSVYGNIKYDLRIDSSKHSAQEIAVILKDLIDTK